MVSAIGLLISILFVGVGSDMAEVKGSAFFMGQVLKTLTMGEQ